MQTRSYSRSARVFLPGWGSYATGEVRETCATENGPPVKIELLLSANEPVMLRRDSLDEARQQAATIATGLRTLAEELETRAGRLVMGEDK